MMPFPRLLVTPPVTKINLDISFYINERDTTYKSIGYFLHDRHQASNFAAREAGTDDQRKCSEIENSGGHTNLNQKAEAKK
jgi:hypothetical protein